MELAYRTGLRLQEQFTLRKDQIDWAVRRATIVGKGGEEETLYLNSRAVEVLRELCQTDSEWVFPSPTDPTRPQSGQSFVARHFKPALGRAGIKRFRWHDLRHTTASWLAIAGEDIYRISKLMRHSSTRMTEIYMHLAPDHLEQAAESVAGPPPLGRNR